MSIFLCLSTLIFCRYDAAVSGPSGNITVHELLTYGAGAQSLVNNVDEDNSPSFTTYTSAHGSVPSYAIHNGEIFFFSLSSDHPPLTTHYLTALGDLSAQTVVTNATHRGGHAELDVHNLFGHLMSRAANLAVRELRPGQRPFLISRSTFAGSGRWTGHWVCCISFRKVEHTQI